MQRVMWHLLYRDIKPVMENKMGEGNGNYYSGCRVTGDISPITDNQTETWSWGLKGVVGRESTQIRTK